MATINHEPIQQAVNRIRQLSADEEAKRLAFVRERALHDEASLMCDAREEGEQIGLKKGSLNAARNLIALGVLSDEQIAAATGLTLIEIQQLR